MALTLMDENETPVDELGEEGIEVELNPNVEEQLEASASNEGIGEVAADSEEVDKPEATEKTPEEIYNEFMEQHPEARDIHGKQAAKRIKKMTYETKEAERQRDAAIEFAQAAQTKLTTLEENQKTQDGAFINEHKSRLEIQLDTVKQDLANAHSLNDSQGVADATQKMARLTNQLDVASQTEARFKRIQDEPVENAPVYQAPQAPRQPDAKAEAWAENNEWFGEDPEMTDVALTIHRKLVTQDGYLPQTDAYYRALDEQIRKNYPDSDYFKDEVAPVQNGKPDLKQPASVVAPASNNATRSNGKGRVHLTPSMVRVAKKLGVPLQEYAKSLEDYNKAK